MPLFAATVSNYVVASFVGYLVLMLAIGAFFSGKMNDLGDYYLGGRKMNKWVVALSAQASDMSGWLLMGLPGAVYLSGFSEAWIGIGLGVGTYLNWKIVAQRLRKYSQVCGDSITIPDFLSNRFRDKTGASRMVAAVIILVFFLFYTASGFVSAAKLFNTMFDMEYSTALWIGAAVVVSYTLLGGYMAVCWTDFIQGSLMFAAIVIVPACVVAAAGGFSATVDQLNEVNPYLQNLFTSASTGKAMGVVGLVSCLAWGLGYFGMPHIIIRFMSVRSDKDIKKSAKIGITWTVLILIFSVASGIIGHILLGEIADSSTVFIQMVRRIFPAAISGILLSAILAASMSTADSQLLASASAFASDVYKPIIRKGKAGDKEMLWAGRIVVLIIAVIAVLIASDPNSGTIMGLVENAWGVFGAAFGPAILLSLFWKRYTFSGAVAGIVAGAAVDILWLALFKSFGLYEIIPGFACGLIVSIVVSLISKAPSKEVTEVFDKVASKEEI